MNFWKLMSCSFNWIVGLFYRCKMILMQVIETLDDEALEGSGKPNDESLAAFSFVSHLKACGV